MKSNAYAAPELFGAIDAAAEAQSRRRGLAGTVQQMAAAWKVARAERAARATLAELDDHLLKDIGIAEDEMHRVRARERFTPRVWRK
jgi:uncharacterized protein YjiS (DUF1127 family)